MSKIQVGNLVRLCEDAKYKFAPELSNVIFLTIDVTPNTVAGMYDASLSWWLCRIMNSNLEEYAKNCYFFEKELENI